MHTHHTLLLCDDDDFVANMFSFRLEAEGYRIVRVNSGEKVVEQVRPVRPSLIILDLMLPRKSGFEILEEIRNDPDVSLRTIPIMVISNLAQDSDVESVLKMGAVCFLVKSLTTPKELCEKVKTFVPVTPT